MSERELAERMGLSRQTLYLWRRSGRIPASAYRKIGTAIIYHDEAAARMIAARRALGGVPTTINLKEEER